MGKSKQQKKNLKAANRSPVGVPSCTQSTQQNISASECSTIASIFERLNSTEPEEREYGCAALGIYLTQPHFLDHLFEKNVVRIIGPLLLDTSINVQLAAAELLRSMSSFGGYTTCEKMIKQEGLTFLGAQLRKLSGSWKEKAAPTKNDKTAEVFINSVNTVQSLCECSELAVRMALEDSIIEVILSCMDCKIFSEDVILATVRCLYVISEDNATIIDMLETTSSQERISQLLTSAESIHLKVAVAGILYNIFDNELITGDKRSMVLSVLAQAVDIESHKLTVSIMEHILDPDNSTSMEQEDLEDADSHMSSLMNGEGIPGCKNTMKKKRTVLLDHLSAQKMAFEILTNLTGGEDDQMIESDTGSEWSYEMEGDMNDSDMETEPESSSVLVKLIDDSDIFKKTVDRLQFLDTALYMKTAQAGKLEEECTVLLRRYESVLISGLLLLNNLIPLYKEVNLLSNMFSELIIITTRKEFSSQDDMIEAITSALRAISVKVLQQEQTLDLTEVHIDALSALAQSSEVKQCVNAVRILASLGCMMAKEAIPPVAMKGVGSTLLNIATQHTELWLVVESIDSLIDMFSEDHTDSVMNNLGVIQALDRMVPDLKKRMKQRDKSESHYLPVLSTVRSNLPRFIKYKKKIG